MIGLFEMRVSSETDSIEQITFTIGKEISGDDRDRDRYDRRQVRQITRRQREERTGN